MRNIKEILGADGPETNRAILIRIRNAGGLARSQGGMATLAQALAPATIEGKVYSEMATRLAKGLKEQNVDAEVTVVEPTNWKAAGLNHMWTDVGVGVGLAGLATLAWYLFSNARGKK